MKEVLKSINNRQYQEDHIEKIIEEVSAKRKVLAQLPTGGGKTVEFSLIAQRYFRSTEKAVLILVHREELMKQAANTIKSITGVTPCFITKNTKHFIVSRVYIGMVESTIKRLDCFHEVGLVIIDECHINNFIKIHNIFLEELIIGFSATPLSASKKEPLNKYYRSIVTGPQISELIQMGYLAQNITRCPKNVVDATKLEIDRLKGDYNEKLMAQEYMKPKHVNNVIRNYHTYALKKKVIIFNVTVEHSKEVNELFNFCGYNSRHLDATSSSRPSIRPGFANEREEIIDWFKNTEDAILNNVMIATVGFDEPTIDTVILNFSTLSLVKFIQTSGRGSRAIDIDLSLKLGCRQKSIFNIIDMGGNCIKFGDWNDDRDWDYIFNNPDKPGDGIAPKKICPECEGMVHASSSVCNLMLPDGTFCEYEFVKRKTKEEIEQGEMMLITKNIDVEKLVEEGKFKYDYWVFFKIGENAVRNMYEKYSYPVSDTIKYKVFEEVYKLCIKWYKENMADQNTLKEIDFSSFHIKYAKDSFEAYCKLLQPKFDF